MEKDFDEIYNISINQASKILETTDYAKFCEEFNHEEVEKLFWHLLREYIEGKIPEHVVSIICGDIIADPVHHNMSREAKIAAYECYELEFITFFEVNEAKAQEIRAKLKKDVSDYFGMWYMNFE